MRLPTLDEYSQKYDYLKFEREDGILRELRTTKNMLADVYTQLGYRAEAGTWRNIYLTGAQELRHGVVDAGLAKFSMALVRATPTSMRASPSGGMYFTALSIRLPNT